MNIPEPETIIEIDGKEYSRLTPAQSKALGLHVIYQDLSLFPNLTVAENIAMEDALHSLGKLVHRDQMVTRAKAALKRLDVELPLDEKVGNLPAGEGLNAATGEYVKMVDAGIIDPAKVTRSALQNAASIAALFLTTEAVIADKPEKAAAMPGGDDMGGMGGMGGF